MHSLTWRSTWIITLYWVPLSRQCLAITVCIKLYLQCKWPLVIQSHFFNLFKLKLDSNIFIHFGDLTSIFIPSGDHLSFDNSKNSTSPGSKTYTHQFWSHSSRSCSQNPDSFPHPQNWFIPQSSSTASPLSLAPESGADKALTNERWSSFFPAAAGGAARIQALVWCKVILAATTSPLQLKIRRVLCRWVDLPCHCVHGCSGHSYMSGIWTPFLFREFNFVWILAEVGSGLFLKIHKGQVFVPPIMEAKARDTLPVVKVVIHHSYHPRPPSVLKSYYPNYWECCRQPLAVSLPQECSQLNRTAPTTVIRPDLGRLRSQRIIKTWV